MKFRDVDEAFNPAATFNPKKSTPCSHCEKKGENTDKFAFTRASPFSTPNDKNSLNNSLFKNSPSFFQETASQNPLCEHSQPQVTSFTPGTNANEKGRNLLAGFHN